MTTNVIKTSFAGGEFDSALFARVDVARYGTGASIMRNYQVDYRGGASTRAGTRFIAEVDDSAHPVILKEFSFNAEQTYMLEFGQYYMRVINNGGLVLSAGVPYKLVTPWSGVDLAKLKFTQSADVLTITHPNYPPYDLTRITNTNWVLTAINFEPEIAAPTIGTATASTAGTTTYRYVITAISATTGEESLASLSATTTASAIMSQNANAYVTVNWTPIAGASLYNIYRQEEIPSAAADINSLYGLIGSTSGSTYQDSNGVPDFGAPPPTITDPFANGRITTITVTAGGSGYTANTTVTVSGAPGKGFNGFPIIAAGVITGVVIRSQGVRYVSPTVTFNDSTGTGATATATVSAPNNWPGKATYYKQRKTFAASYQFPQTLWMTQTALYRNMNVSFPGVDTDAITLTINSQQVNEIKSLVPASNGLIAFTSGGAFVVNGNSDGVLTPATVRADPQVGNGASDLQPLFINGNILYVQEQGNTVRDLQYDFLQNVFTGNDLTVFSKHLFENREIVSWAYAEEPNKIVWMVRDDGVLLSLTYLKEQEVNGIARHDTDGLFERVASTREGAESAVYFVVRRIIEGRFIRYIERIASRNFAENKPQNIEADVTKAWCVDCALELPQYYPPMELYPAAASGTGVNFQTSASGAFDASMVGRIIRCGGGIAVITAFVNSSRVTCDIIKPITSLFPNDPASTPFIVKPGEWSCNPVVSTVSGLDHLEGKEVAILADGNVLPRQTVVSGSVTLDTPSSVVVVGLPYRCILGTLRLDLGDGSIQGKRKRIPAVTVRVKATRGLKMGSTLNTLVPYKQRTSSVFMGQAIPLSDDDQRIILDQNWNADGQMFFVQDDPLPATILGCIPEIVVGDTNK
jgi:hypothetical protein